MNFYPWGGPQRPVVADKSTLSYALMHRLDHLHSLTGDCVKNRFDNPAECKVLTKRYLRKVRA